MPIGVLVFVIILFLVGYVTAVLAKLRGTRDIERAALTLPIVVSFILPIVAGVCWYYSLFMIHRVNVFMTLYQLIAICLIVLGCSVRHSYNIRCYIVMGSMYVILGIALSSFLVVASIIYSSMSADRAFTLIVWDLFGIVFLVTGVKAWREDESTVESYKSTVFSVMGIMLILGTLGIIGGTL